MFKGKLRNKIFLMMVLVSVVPVVIGGFLSVWSVTISHREDVARLEEAIINQTFAEIDNLLMGIIESGVKVKLDVDSEQIIEGRLTLENIGNFIFPNIFKEELLKPITDIAFISIDGKEAVRYSRYVPEFRVPTENLRDQSSLEKFLVAKSGKNYIGKTYRTLAGPMITVSSPLYTKDDVLVGITAAEVNLKGVAQIVERASLGRSGYVYLIDRGGFLVAGGGDTMRFDTRLLQSGIAKEALEGKDFLGPDNQRRYANFAGEMVVAAGKFLPKYGWALIAEWPVAEADKGINDLLYKNLTVLAIVILAVVIASILLATFIVRPIKALERGTEKVAEGKFEEKITIKTGDELEELGEAFNKMMVGLKRLEELKEEFVFIAAHELRTPVAAMKGYLSLILEGATGGVNEQTRDFVSKVIRANDRLVQLVNDLLEVSRSEAGRLTIKVAPIDIVEPIRQTLTELEKMAEEQKVTMNYEPRTDLPKVLADPDRVKEVMVNLVGNAIKYMGPIIEGKPREVTISHELINHELVTHIRDTGLGMSKEAQKKLFEKFYRIAREETREITGTGLGLFIVKEIVEKMGGKVWAFSEGEGRGSTFSFSLPLAT